MTASAPIGHNNPPDPIDEINAQFEAWRLEAENWTDGDPVETEAEMQQVDALRAAMRNWRIALEKGQKDATAPLRAAYQAELDRWKPSIEDAKRYEARLVAAVDNFKRRLAAERAEAERAAQVEAERAAQALRAAHADANPADLDAQRALAQAERDAEDARIRAAVARKQAHVKGLRTVTRYKVIDPVALARWLWAHDRDAQLAFHAERARQLALHIPGVVEQVKEKVTA